MSLTLTVTPDLSFDLSLDPDLAPVGGDPVSGGEEGVLFDVLDPVAHAAVALGDVHLQQALHQTAQLRAEVSLKLNLCVTITPTMTPTMTPCPP